MKKLLLFDIDGTLIYHLGHSETKAIPRYKDAIKKVFGIEVKLDKWIYEGWVDRQIIWDIVQKANLSKSEFDEKYLQMSERFHDFLEEHKKTSGSLYEAIDGVKDLLIKLTKLPEFILGILTGNMEKIAWWKLEHAGIKDGFDFGLFGEEADDRHELAKMVFKKFKNKYGFEIKGEQIYIIGDTIHDINCGKAIGAKTIAVTTGEHVDEKISELKPDLLVDNLNDPRVYKFINVNEK